jgi:hypothetical protein
MGEKHKTVVDGYRTACSLCAITRIGRRHRFLYQAADFGGRLHGVAVCRSLTRFCCVPVTCTVLLCASHLHDFAVCRSLTRFCSVTYTVLQCASHLHSFAVCRSLTRFCSVGAPHCMSASWVIAWIIKPKNSHSSDRNS